MSEIEKLAEALCDDFDARLIAGQEYADRYADSTQLIQGYWRALAKAAAINSPAPVKEPLTEVREKVARFVEPKSWKALGTSADSLAHGNRRISSLRKADAILALLIPERDVVIEDTELLDALRDESWDLRSFAVPTGGGDEDVAWRVVGHWQAEPHERVVAEEYSDDPRVALRAAIRSLKGV